MTDLQIFNNNDFGEVRALEKDGQAWFVASDVCKVLDIKNATQAINRLDEDERSMLNIGRQGEANIINEYGLYSLVLSSRKNEAKQFKRWITHDVIPSIHKHGAYMTPQKIEEALLNPDTIIQLATALKNERTKALLLEQRVAEYEPKIQYVDQILKSKGVMAITQIAADYGMSPQALNKIMFEEHVQRKVNDQWILYKEHMNLGYTKSETIHIIHSDGTPDTKLQTKWTQKGRLMIHNILTARGIKANVDKLQAS